MIPGCAFFHDLLKPSAFLCKILQEDYVCVVRSIEAILKTSKAVDKLKTTSIEDLPTVQKVMARTKNESGCTTYQGMDLTI